MMVVAMLVLWGGLVASLLHLRRSDNLPEAEQTHRDL